MIVMITKMKYLPFFIFISIACCNFVNGQTIEGIILDSSSHEPIPFAHIYSSNTGTISNVDGKFVINHSLKGKTSLVVSHVSYKSLGLMVENDTSLVIYLTLDVTSLDDVVIDGSAREIARTLFEKMKLASTQENFGKAFYRQITKYSNQPTEWIEGFLDVSYNRSRIRKYDLTQARVAAKSALIGQDSIFIPINGIFYYSFFPLYVETVKSNNLSIPFSENEFEDYHFYVEKQFMKGQDTMFVISFKPIGEMDSEATASGSFTYNYSTQIFYEMELEYNNLGLISRDPNNKYEIIESQGTVVFNYNQDNNNDIEYIFWDCPFKFTYDDKTYDASINTMLYLYERGAKKSRRLSKPDFSVSTFEKFYEAKYRPRFWKDNPIIKRTQEEENIISSFETENAFGTYFKRKKKK